MTNFETLSKLLIMFLGRLVLDQHPADVRPAAALRHPRPDQHDGLWFRLPCAAVEEGGVSSVGEQIFCLIP